MWGRDVYCSLPPAHGIGKLNYQITDHLGSVRVIKDGEGTVLQRFDYYSFGSESRVWTAGTSTPQSALRYRFGGKEIAGQKVSVSTGAPAAAAGSPYLDFGARVYDPRTAAWLSQDPLSEKYYGISPYAYCAGNPVNLVDPEGMDIWELQRDGRVIRKEKSDSNVKSIENNIPKAEEKVEVPVLMPKETVVEQKVEQAKSLDELM